MVSLGEKIKLFRTTSGLSQFELETSLDLGYGSISRMESNQTIPTRKTLIKISNYLRLNDRQFDYLIGSRETVPSEEEVQRAISITSRLWDDENLFVILRDDHFRLCAASKGIRKLFKISETDWSEKCYLQNIITVMLNPQLQFSHSFNILTNPNAEADLRTLLTGFYYEMSFMQLEPDYKETLREINKHPLAQSILNNLITDKTYPPFYLITDRRLRVYIDTNVVDLIFYTEVIPDSTRFSFIHFLENTYSKQ
jgi:transcriptional regulator with XRE-family HTH domain